MMIHTIKEIVQNDNNATFNYLRIGSAYYSVSVNEKDLWYKYTFTVDLNDIGDATLSLYEKAIMLMRYIRKSIEDGTIVCTEYKYE